MSNITTLSPRQAKLLWKGADHDMVLPGGRGLVLPRSPQDSLIKAAKAESNGRRRVVPNVWATFQGKGQPREGFLSTEVMRACVDTLIELVCSAEVTVQDLEDNPIPGALSKRQKWLIDLWREAGSHTFESEIAGNDGLTKSTVVDSGPECVHDWDEVYGLGSLTKAATGALKRDEKGRNYQSNTNNRWQRFERGQGDLDPTLRFFPEDGEFGKGIYLQVGEPSGHQGVKAIVKTEGDLCRAVPRPKNETPSGWNRWRSQGEF